MSFQASSSRNNVSGKPCAKESKAAGQGQGRIDPMQPLLAGAHARGMADALALAGVAAVLIDAQGMVLHAGALARDLFGSDLRLDHEHLIGRTAESTRAIQTAITEALADGDLPDPVIIPRAGHARYKLHVRPVPGAAKNPCQLLKALIMIEELPPRLAGN
jgi:hypothetical protein